MRFLVLAVVAGCAHRTPAVDLPSPACQDEASTVAGARSTATGSVGALSDRPIASVRVTGADPALAATLAKVIETHPGDNLANAHLADDIRRLWAVGVLTDVVVDATPGAAGAELTFAVTPQPLIDRVEITGDARDEAELRRIRVLPGTPFEATRIARMADAIEKSYVYEGYLDAKVRAHRMSGAGVGVCVRAHRGPRVTIGRITFPGRSELADAQLLAVIRGGPDLDHPGGIYDPELLEDAVLRLQALYWDHGKADIHVDEPRIDRHGNQVDIAIPIHEGNTYHYGTIRVTALPLGTAAAGDLGLRTGEEFNRTNIAALRERLEARFGPNASVVPNTHLDVATHTIDLDFEITWDHLWNALQFWPRR